jgi:uncharacterized membrane protein
LPGATEPGFAGVWSRLGVWLLLGLQFALGADIVRSAIAPTWNDIGQLAAIAVIRTFLALFLERDLTELAEYARAGQRAAPGVEAKLETAE